MVMVCPTKGGERWGEGALALKVDAVPLHCSALGDGQQKSVEFLETVRNPRQPAFSNPGVVREGVKFAVNPGVVGSDELSDPSIEIGEVQYGFRFQASGFRLPAAGTNVSRESGEQLGVDGAEEPLDLSSSLWSADDGVDEADVQFDGGAFEVVAGEVGPVIDVQNVGDVAHRPRGSVLCQIACRSASAVLSAEVRR